MALAMRLGLHPRALFDLSEREFATVIDILNEWSERNG